MVTYLSMKSSSGENMMNLAGTRWGEMPTFEMPMGYQYYGPGLLKLRPAMGGHIK